MGFYDILLAKSLSGGGGGGISPTFVSDVFHKGDLFPNEDVERLQQNAVADVIIIFHLNDDSVVLPMTNVYTSGTSLYITCSKGLKTGTKTDQFSCVCWMNNPDEGKNKIATVDYTHNGLRTDASSFYYEIFKM